LSRFEFFYFYNFKVPESLKPFFFIFNLMFSNVMFFHFLFFFNFLKLFFFQFFELFGSSIILKVQTLFSFF